MLLTVRERATPVVVVAETDTLVLRAAQLMRQHHVGAIVVVENTETGSRPVGIVTDRDLVLGVMAEGLDPAVFTVGDVMSAELATVRDDATLAAAMQLLAERCVRRLVVVDAEGRLVGILTLEDMLATVSEGMAAINTAIQAARDREISSRR